MKRLLIVVAVLVALGALALGLVLGIGYYLAPQSKLSHVDAIVAISGGETDARADEAVQLYRDGYATTIIFSGAAADPSGPSNARAMEERAVAEGVKPNQILLDEASANTAENATAVAKIVKDQEFHSIVLVTSPYHQRRADIEFSRAMGTGVKIINHSAFDQNWSRSRWWERGYNYPITLAELQKTLFLLVTDSK